MGHAAEEELISITEKSRFLIFRVPSDLFDFFRKMSSSSSSPPIRLRQYRVPGDGDCLFHSIGLAIGLPALTVRRAVVEHLLNSSNGKAMLMRYVQSRTVKDPDLRTYLRAMIRSGTWGGELELQSAADLYRRTVYVHLRRDPQNPLVFRPTHTGDSSTLASIHLLYNGRNHYDALLPTLQDQEVNVKKRARADSADRSRAFPAERSRSDRPLAPASHRSAPRADPVPRNRTVRRDRKPV